MVVESETLEVSSASEEESEPSVEEMSEENEEDESDKEIGQKSSDDYEEYIEEDEGIQERQQIDDEKVTIQHNDLVDLRTELKRRRALRLNTVKFKLSYLININ
jgi:hypothetical protein